MERIFLWIFTSELILKVLAYGFVMHRHSYLRDPWCQLDFVVVTLAWVPVFVPSFAQYSFIRALRALRPLRTLRFLPGMPVLIGSIFKSIPPLGNVAGLCSFIFLIFGIVGEELFEGALHYQCHYEGESIPPDHRMLLNLGGSGGGGSSSSSSIGGSGRMVGRAIARSGRALKGGGGGGTAAEFCAPNDPNACVDLDTGRIGACLYYADNPEETHVDYDSVINACMGIVQIITFDTWTPAMYNLMKAVSSYVWVYYLLVALLGGFFVVNLFLAVVFDEFMRSKEIEEVSSKLEGNQSDAVEAKAHAGLDESDSAPMLARQHTMMVFSGKTVTRKGGFRSLRPLVDSKAFSYMTIIVLLCNLILMCMPYAGQSEAYTQMLEELAMIFTGAFVVELLIKLLGLGWEEFVANPWNIFDSILVFISVADSLITLLGVSGHFNVTYLRVLRMLRVMRMMRMMQHWKGLLRIFTCLMGAGQQLVNIFVLLFVFMTMFALLGMQLFGGGCGSDESRFHFDYYMPAMLTVLSIFSGGWVDPFIACTETSIPLARIFALAALVIGFFVIFNLFIAILLDSFASEEEEEEEEGESGAEGDAVQGSSTEGRQQGGRGDDSKDRRSDSPEEANPTETPDMLPLKRFSLRLVRHPLWESFIIAAILLSSVTLVIDHPRLDHASKTKAVLTQCNYFFTALFTVELLTKVFAYDLLVVGHEKEVDGERVVVPDGYLLSPWNLLDLFIVTISLISLCPEMKKLAALRLLRVLRPLRLLSRIPGMKVIFEFFAIAAGDVINVTGVVLFFQTVFAILGMELFMGSFASCTNPEIRIKDLCVPGAPALLGSAIGAIDGHRNLQQLASSINKSSTTAPPLPLAETQLPFSSEAAWIDKLPTVPSWIFPSDAPEPVWLPFPSAAPTQQMEEQVEAASSEDAEAEALYVAIARRRQDSWTASRESSGGQRQGRQLKGGGSGGGGNGVVLPVSWQNPSFGSFDDFGSAMLILFIAATGDGWEDFMFAGMDAVGEGKSPQRNDFSPAALFFVAWLLVGTFTMMNLFVGSVVDNFTKIKADLDGSATMTKAQKQWVRTMQEASQKQKPDPLPKPPRSQALRPIFNLVTSKAFDIVITVVIISNILVMAIDFHHIEEYPSYYSFYTGAMTIFGNIYYLECILKLLGLGVGSYFRDGWNRFDFFLVTTSLLDQFAAETMAKVMPIPPMLMRMLRVLRIMRIMRLLKGFKGLRDLLMTMVLSFPSFLNVGALLGLVTFIYAVLGVQLFTFVMEGDELNDQRNFLNFSSAYLLLVQCLTGDNWSGLMYDAMVGPERGCDPTLMPTNCGNSIAIPYFMSYTVVGGFVLLNLVVAVILENFTALGDVNPDLVSANDISEFGEIWATKDEDATGLIAPEALADVLLIMPPPLGLAGKMSKASVLKMIHDFDLDPDNLDGGYLRFAPVTEALIRRSYESNQVEATPEIEHQISLSRAPSRSSHGSASRPTSRAENGQLHQPSEKRCASPASVSPLAASTIRSACTHQELARLAAAKAASMAAGGPNGNHPAAAERAPSKPQNRPVHAPSLAYTTPQNARESRSVPAHTSPEFSPELSPTRAKPPPSYVPVPAPPPVCIPKVRVPPNYDHDAYGVKGRTAGEPPQLGATPPSLGMSTTVFKAHMPPVRRPSAKLPPPGTQTLPDPARLPAPSPGQTPGSIPPPPRPPPGQPPRLPEGWKCVTTRAGAYYYNEITRQVSWQPPIEWLTQRPHTRGPHHPRGPGWDA